MQNNKVICVGRNYAAHAKELNNAVPQEPILFIKPFSTVVPFEEPIQVSGAMHPIHYEIELAVLIGKTIKNADTVTASNAIDGIGLALDLTMRELQQELAAKGQPWEKAKSFDASCPMSQIINIEDINLAKLGFNLFINGELRQQGNSNQMLTPIVALVEYASRYFTLQQGDILITGTPAGVGRLNPGDTLKANIEGFLSVETTVI